MQHHPDKAGDTMRAVAQAINAAYECLTDPESKAAYDRKLPAEKKEKKKKEQKHTSAVRGGWTDIDPDDAAAAVADDAAPPAIAADDFCGDFYAGRCWGLGCTKIHCTQKEFWDFIETKTVSFDIVSQKRW